MFHLIVICSGTLTGLESSHGLCVLSNAAVLYCDELLCSLIFTVYVGATEMNHLFQLASLR